MRRKLYLALILSLGISSAVFGQITVDNVNPLTAYPNDTIVVTGSGFSATAGDLQVWFGAAEGTIMACSDFAIEVKVPAGARLDNITVTNKVTRLSAKSKLKFTPAVRTETFTIAKFVQAFEQLPRATNPQHELWDLCICDMNSDGKPDIASTKFQRSGSSYAAASDILLLQNTTPLGGPFSFTKIDGTTAGSNLNLGFPTDNVVCGDLNGDGKPELVVSRAGATRNSIHIFRNQSTASVSFAAPTNLFLDVGHLATRINIRDLNNDGKPDLIVTNSQNDIFYIFINTSSGGTLSFNTTPLKFDIEPAAAGTIGTYDLEVQDFNDDGWADIVINRFVENNLYIFKNLKSSSINFAAPVVHSTNAIDVKFQRVSSADFNKDGKLDLLYSNSALAGAKLSSIFLNQSTTGGDITFTPDASAIKFNPSNPAVAGPWGVDVSDMDGDGDIDFGFAGFGVTQLDMYMHNGNFSTNAFTKHVIPLTTPTPWNPRNIKINDMDGDGKPDIIFTAQNDGTATTAIEIVKNNLCHQPVIENEDNLKICNGQVLVLKTIQANNVTLAWTKDGGAVGTNSPFLTITAPGTYRVTNTTNGCTTFDEIVVTTDTQTAPSDPPINGNTPLCVGGTLNLSTNAVASATYTWTKPDGSTLSGQNQSLTVSLNDAGIYSLQVQVGVSKSDVVTKRIDVANLNNFTIASNPISATICAGGSATLSVNNVANHSYKWQFNGADISPAVTTPTHNASTEGSYTVVVTNNTLNCSNTTPPQTLTVLTTPSASFTAASTACTGTALSFTNTTSNIDPDGTIAYTWNFNQGAGSTDTNPTKTYTTAGTFNATVTASYSNASGTGCSHTSAPQPITVSAAVVPVITMSTTSPANSLCPDGASTETATLTATGGTFSSTTWSNTQTTNPITISTPGTYTVNTVDANGCPGTDDHVVTERPAPVITASSRRSTIASGDTTLLEVVITPADPTATYLWDPAETLSHATAGVDAKTQPNPIATPPDDVTYTVTVTNSQGCSAEAEVAIIVEGVLGFPAAFSPNGDNINDTWNIRAQDNPDCSLSIFDGKGRRIFESKGQNWDGTASGKEVPAGTYFYVYGCPSEAPMRGNVLVIR